jgi:hypothetical protein
MQWKKHPEHPAITGKEILIRKLHYIDPIKNDISYSYKIAEFKKPHDKEPEKYNPDFYQQYEKLPGDHVWEFEWLDVAGHFEWCELE